MQTRQERRRLDREAASAESLANRRAKHEAAEERKTARLKDWLTSVFGAQPTTSPVAATATASVMQSGTVAAPTAGERIVDVKRSG